MIALLLIMAGAVAFAAGSFWMFVDRPLLPRNRQREAPAADESLERQGMLVFTAGFFLLIAGIALW